MSHVVRRRQHGMSGFTLIEALVSLTLLAVIGTVVGVVLSVGLRTILQPGASRDRLAASSDAIALEQLLAQDVHRATCVQTPNQPLNGECPSNFESHCTLSDLCMEWPDLAISNQCDVSVYSQSAGSLSRSVWLGAAGTTVSYQVVISAKPSAAGPTWPASVAITLTGSLAQLTNPPHLSFDLQPIATLTWPTDPVTSASTNPC